MVLNTDDDNDMDGICYRCDEACDHDSGCTGSGPSKCNKCKLGTMPDGWDMNSTTSGDEDYFGFYWWDTEFKNSAGATIPSCRKHCSEEPWA